MSRLFGLTRKDIHEAESATIVARFIVVDRRIDPPLAAPANNRGRFMVDVKDTRTKETRNPN